MKTLPWLLTLRSEMKATLVPSGEIAGAGTVVRTRRQNQRPSGDTETSGAVTSLVTIPMDRPIRSARTPWETSESISLRRIVARSTPRPCAHNLDPESPRVVRIVTGTENLEVLQVDLRPPP